MPKPSDQPRPALRSTRRRFCIDSAALLAASGPIFRGASLKAQTRPPSAANPTRPDVAAIDHERILAAAQRVLSEPLVPLTALRSDRSPGGPQDYYSESDPAPEASSSFTAHRDALLNLSLRTSALAAAHLLTGDRRYSNAAANNLRPWFIDPATRMNPRMEFGAAAPPVNPAASAPTTAFGEAGTYAGILETLPLVEIVQAIPFLAAAGSLTPADRAGLQTWFAAYLRWLTTEQDTGPRLAALARDHKDHHATSWLLQVTAYTLFTVPDTGAPPNEDRAVTDLRRRFRSVILRAQVSPEGVFRNEVSTPNPYRNSLFNLDMLACLCELLSTRFEDVWQYQLEDGPGMRAAIAYHFPYIANRARWPYRADQSFFSQLPSRRVSLLFSARAYQQPDYTALWTSLRPDPTVPAILRTLPVHQPVLWVSRPQRTAD